MFNKCMLIIAFILFSTFNFTCNGSICKKNENVQPNVLIDNSTNDENNLINIPYNKSSGYKIYTEKDLLDYIKKVEEEAKGPESVCVVIDSSAEFKCVRMKIYGETTIEFSSNRFDIKLKVDSIIIFIENIKHEYGIPPQYDEKSLLKNIDRDIFLFGLPKEPEKMIKEIKYLVSDNKYNMFIILNYKAKESSNYSVIKVVNGKAFWKDNIAKENQKISEIEWDKVNYLYADYNILENGKVTYMGELPFPEYIK